MKVKFGVIGADPKLRANFIFQNFSREKGELVMVCDCNPEKLDSFREAYPEFASIQTCTDYRDMVCDPEVQGIFIAVRDQYHEEMSVAALEAGKAVYLEKPMAITIEGCDRILETAYRTTIHEFSGIQSIKTKSRFSFVNSPHTPATYDFLSRPVETAGERRLHVK